MQNLFEPQRPRVADADGRIAAARSVGPCSGRGLTERIAFQAEVEEKAARSLTMGPPHRLDGEGADPVGAPGLDPERGPPSGVRVPAKRRKQLRNPGVHDHSDTVTSHDRAPRFRPIAPETVTCRTSVPAVRSDPGAVDRAPVAFGSSFPDLL